jgi:putative tricarboxylic transport membrane protein
MRTRMDELKILPKIIVGDELHERINQRMEYFSNLELPGMIELPNVVAWTIGALLVFGVGMIRRSLIEPVGTNETIESVPKRYDLAWKSIVLVIIYVSVMSLDLMSFIWSTLLFVPTCVILLNGFHKTKMVYVLEITLLMSFGLNYVFTELFMVALP